VIVGAHLVQYELPFHKPVSAGDGVHESRSGFLLGLVDDGGRTGWGEAAPLPGWSVDSFSGVEAGLRGMVGSIVERQRTADGLRPTAAAWVGRLPSAAAALDAALLDLVAQQMDQSLAAHLSSTGDAKESVSVNALVVGTSPDEVAAAGTTAADEGFRAFKLKVGAGSMDMDLARVAALREVVGDEGAMRLDAERRWDLSEAVERLARMEIYDIEYVEDPVDSLDAMVQLSMSCPVPLAADALLARSTDPLGVVTTAVADFFVLKPAALGGLTITSALAMAALGRSKGVVVTSFLDSAVGLAGAVALAAALPGEHPASGLATSYLFSENVAPPPPITEGAIRVPAGPGLGVAPSKDSGSSR